MYDPQLEKLITMALQDGVISERVRSILLRKAQELGVDKDELEIDLEMRLAKIKRTESNGIGIGNDNIVKATIQGGDNAPPPVPRKPIMNIGNDNVIKAEIDASTNVFHDNSVKVEGTYVAQQTIINEEAIAPLLKLFTGILTNENIEKIEEKISHLPNNPVQLGTLLAKTLRHIIREAKISFKQQESLFSFDPNLSKLGHFERVNHVYNIGKVDSQNEKRLDLAEKILNKLHDIGSNSRNSQLILNIEKLDDCIINTRQLLLKINYLPITKMFVMIGGFGAIGGLLMLKVPNGPEWWFCYCLSFAGAYWWFKKNQSQILEKLISSENVLNKLVNNELIKN